MLRLLPRSLARPTPTRLFSTSQTLLAGHNKWSKIQGKKGIADRNRGVALTKARRDIVIAVRSGGNSIDPEKNPALAVVLRRLKDSDIPKDNIERALAGALKSDEKAGDTVLYEAMACGTVGVLIECLTNNPTRTIQDIRTILSRNNARIAPVKFMFQQTGVVRVALEDPTQQEALAEKAFDGGALDFQESTEDDGKVEVEFICEPASVSALTQVIMSSGHPCELVKSEIVYRPQDPVESVDEEVEGNMGQLMAVLEDNEDVSRVFTTLDD
ncbi:YebC-like protein, partial [Cylindrobasidium torrendii FP15055 ss-10]